MQQYSYRPGRPVAGQTKNHRARSSRRRHFALPFMILIVLAIVGVGSYIHFRPTATTHTVVAASPLPTTTTPSTPPTAVAPAATQVATTVCSGNSLSQLVIVSISERKLTACNGGTMAYTSAVITGMDHYAADVTPTGTYHVQSKFTDKYLRGSDSTGSWNDYVHYWMPFLENQYGTYGFHDATWRQPTDFGNISPDSSDASHGCVELPLATAQWLFNWVQDGTTVTIDA